MTIVDAGLGIPFLVAVFFWIRGAWRRCGSDLAVGAALFAFSIAFYGYFFAFTGLSGLPWIAALLGAAGTAPLAFIRRKDRAASGRAALLVTAAAIAGAILLAAETKWVAGSNSLLVIAPYRQAGTWVFDDPGTGLKAEPFVAGIPELIDKLVAEAGIPNADRGFRLLFSTREFPGFQVKAVWRRRENAGNWYFVEKYGAEGWLCPALFKYFKRAPKDIYVKAEKK